jgi:hypothetical protein
MKSIALITLLCLCTALSAQNGTQQYQNLGDMLSHTGDADRAGPAPKQFTTPFLVAALSPIGGDACTAVD